MEKMRDRIRRSMNGAALTALAIFGVLVIGFFYLIFTEQYRAELRNEMEYVSAAFESGADVSAFFDHLDGVTSRLTLIDADGTVFFDNAAGPEGMGNHLSRPEVQQALENGAGYAARYSDTLGERTYYYAVRLSDGRVLRLSGTQDSVFGLLPRILMFFVIACVVLMPVVLGLSDRVTGAIVQPINTIRLDDPGESRCDYEELVPLFERLKSQKIQIDHQMRELTARQREFSTVTDTMNEGMIVLNDRTEILAVNRSAAALFGIPEQEGIGRPLRTLCSDQALERVVTGAEDGRPTRELISENGRFYQLMASPVRGSGQSIGVVVLVTDVTDQHEAERQRRDFSANVSHELKTPLTSIMGFAEIMENGFAPEADMRGFAGRIHEEAARLLTLIDDIIHLSRLDEQAGLPESEPVDLLDLAGVTAERLNSRAEARGISMTVRGDALTVRGIRPVLSEMIFNLADNAIKYNVEGGRVDISVSEQGGRPALTVSDTGIGIAPEHQEHIFERFYRVDKSHSREIGGTGLGLSIVKHAALLHNAEIKVDSAPGKGTSLCVLFPAQKEGEADRA